MFDICSACLGKLIDLDAFCTDDLFVSGYGKKLHLTSCCLTLRRNAEAAVLAAHEDFTKLQI